MNETRPTTTFTIEETIGEHVIKKVFEINLWLTAKDDDKIQEIALKSIKMGIDDKNQPVLEGFDPTVDIQQKKALIEAMLVSIDGNEENCYEALSELPSVFKNKVLEQIDFITKKK